MAKRGGGSALRLLGQALRGQWGVLTWALLLAVLLALPGAAVPLVTRWTADQMSGGADRLFWLAAAVLALRAVHGLLVVESRRSAGGLKAAVGLTLRRRLMHAWLQRAHLSQLRTRTQLLTAHMTQDIDRVEAAIDSAIGGAAPALLAGIAMTAVLIWTSPPLSLLLIPAGLFVAGVLALGQRRLGAAIDRRLAAQDRLLGATRFLLDAFTLIRLRGAGGSESRRQDAVYQQVAATNLDVALDAARVAQLQALAVAAAGAGVLAAGAALNAHGRLSLGGLISFMTAAALAAAQVERLTAGAAPVMEGFRALQRVAADLSAAEPEPYRGAGRIDWSGAVDLQGVVFGFGDRRLLDGLDLALRPGEAVGLEGPNGAGKTTLIHLLLGLYRPAAGRVLADGVAYDDLDLRPIRARIGYAPQHPALFDGSLRDNVLYGLDGVDEADLRDLIDDLEADWLLNDLPDELLTQVGEGGVRLSGGQRQMVSILRALAGRPRLVILDEPTNHLSPDRVARLVAAITALPEDPAVLVVSHDRAVSSALDRVYRLRDGRLDLVDEL